MEIEAYKTISGEYRAYVKGKPSLQAWGATKKKAIENLKKKYESHCFNDGWCLCPKSH